MAKTMTTKERREAAEMLANAREILVDEAARSGCPCRQQIVATILSLDDAEARMLRKVESPA
ncbi:MAG: hypothetical protein ACOC9T_00045 [Myxococcota bacterium]